MFEWIAEYWIILLPLHFVVGYSSFCTFCTSVIRWATDPECFPRQPIDGNIIFRDRDIIVGMIICTAAGVIVPFFTLAFFWIFKIKPRMRLKFNN